MSLTWHAEKPAVWDAEKQSVVGAVPDGCFPKLANAKEGEILGAEWWRVERDGEVVGYGWLDATWGWAPVLLAVRPDCQGQGIGSFIVQMLEVEAHKHGLAYLFNVVPATHPDPEGVTAWLEAHGFESSEVDPGTLRLHVREPGPRAA